MTGKVTVVGSINVDMVTTSEKMPKQGETILGEAFHTVPGGKGANQAVAAAKLGADVTMLGKVGEDAIGKEMIANLQKEKVCTDYVEPVTGISTGVATILLSGGDNRIIVTPGANLKVTPEYVRRHEKVLRESDIVLIQFEIPLETVEEVLRICEAHQVPVVINPAPAQKLKKVFWEKATWITPNETERDELFDGHTFSNKMIVTLGGEGVLLPGAETVIPGFSVTAVDTTGAGDTFNGALASSLAAGKPVTEAVSFANAAAAISVTEFGAQGGMPLKKAVMQLLEKGGPYAEKRNT
ncbi:ribokinase [Alkalicoccus halolimnae]|uniref:Ribokinase n=1 Tax=Alkalicoccus halolimnae TaxID=1667239 RepID=A0A5C7FJD5_9BACI|nr:ribokinase [Alkalicoccus halolimnae]TXF85536.1 ribokinase [Alkalicoccus halolimnae]